MNAGATIWRWWNQSSPLAISSPRPIKCFEPCCCSHDLPEAWVYFDDSSSFIISVSVRHILGSLPYQKINLFPDQPKPHLSLIAIQKYYNRLS
ncbi:unnamed protein product [Spirodela intermedia]|uniref:Uncharacterized protein n=2 Tax=Spirodela intermedia TaxID=51605 RepID=A0A7I8J5W9_SPIIN|nr:unnamed protein product [Spirodela intermedia]CAA6664832.1 unnamed protein product [Spirodela intermedia]CAA7401433.1 unnamed protein product [Spirodela intermedia]